MILEASAPIIEGHQFEHMLLNYRTVYIKEPGYAIICLLQQVVQNVGDCLYIVLSQTLQHLPLIIVESGPRSCVDQL